MISSELFELILLILFSAPIVLFLFFVIRSLVTYDAKKLSSINKIIKEAKISEIQKIGDVNYNPIPTLDQKDRISEKFLNSNLIIMSNISRIETENVFEGEIESVPFISADLSVYKKYSTNRFKEREFLSLSGTYYYFDIPTIERGVNIVLVPRTHFALLIFFMLISLFLLWISIYKKVFELTLASIFFMLYLLAYYFQGPKTGGIKFISYFLVQTNNEIKARKILTPAVIQSIIDLREKEGEIMIAIKEGQLHVFIKNRNRFYYKFNYKDDLTKIKENIAQEVRQEIDLIKRLLKSIKS
jgi:hypothetical protein